MADLTGTPTFKNTIRGIETSDPIHPTTVNPPLQDLLNNTKHLKDAQAVHEAEKAKYQTATGSNTIAITTGGDFTLTQGNFVKWIQAGANTGATTINIDGKGAKALKNSDRGALVAGDLEAGKGYEAYYSLSDDFFVLPPRGAKLDEIITAVESKGGTIADPKKPTEIADSITNDLFGTGSKIPVSSMFGIDGARNLGYQMLESTVTPAIERGVGGATNVQAILGSGYNYVTISSIVSFSSYYSSITPPSASSILKHFSGGKDYVFFPYFDTSNYSRIARNTHTSVSNQFTVIYTSSQQSIPCNIMTVDKSNDDVYFVDYPDSTLKRYDFNGNLIATYACDYRVNTARIIEDNIYVVCHPLRIEVFDRITHAHIRTIILTGLPTSLNSVNTPNGVVVDHESNIYFVASNSSNIIKIIKVNPNGEFIWITADLNYTGYMNKLFLLTDAVIYSSSFGQVTRHSIQTGATQVLRSFGSSPAIMDVVENGSKAVLTTRQYISAYYHEVLANWGLFYTL